MRTGPDRGFTLIETIISMTVMALVVTVLYTAFSTALDTWRRQEAKTDDTQRLFQLHRMLEDDFRLLAPYTFNWAKGKETFFGGNGQTLFYVTRSGFGSRLRSQGELFFTCLFLSTDENGTQSLSVYKTPYPEPELLEALHAFHQADEAGQGVYSPDGVIREQAVTVTSGLTEASFLFASKTDAAQSLSNLGNQTQETNQTDTPAGTLATWSQAKYPALVIFTQILHSEPMVMRMHVRGLDAAV